MNICNICFEVPTKDLKTKYIIFNMNKVILLLPILVVILSCCINLTDQKSIVNINVSSEGEAEKIVLEDQDYKDFISVYSNFSISTEKISLDESKRLNEIDDRFKVQESWLVLVICKDENIIIDSDFLLYQIPTFTTSDNKIIAKIKEPVKSQLFGAIYTIFTKIIAS